MPVNQAVPAPRPIPPVSQQQRLTPVSRPASSATPAAPPAEPLKPVWAQTHIPVRHEPSPRPLETVAASRPIPVTMHEEPASAESEEAAEQPATEAEPIRLSMELPAEAEEQPRGRMRRLFGRHPLAMKWSKRSGMAVAGLVIVTGSVLLVLGYINLHKIFRGGAKSAAALQANVDPSLLKGEGDGRINILLLGRGGGGHEAPDLTDTIMLASIDPVNHKASLLSVPRDLWVDLPGYGAMKINAAFETGEYKYLGKMVNNTTDPKAIQAGFDMTDQVVEQVLGVPIHYNMVVDFQAFKQAINTVGGISVVVPSQLYDPTMAWENHGNPVLAQPGIHSFDGSQALLYVRSRETSSDFARSSRQRAVLVALKSKAVSLGTLSNPFKISQLMSDFGNNAQTDLSLNDASRLYQIIKGINADQTVSVDLDTPPHNFVTTAAINGQSVVEPRAGMFSYKEIQDFVHNELRDGYLQNENAKIEVLNGTRVEGLATTKADMLKGYGYFVSKVANAPTSGYAKTVVVDLTNGRDKYTKHYLEERFGVTAVTALPDPSIKPTGADFVVILGAK